MFGRKFDFGARRRPVVKPATSALKLMRLETRCCPTVTAVLAGGILTITGNGGSDHVFITQEDDGDLRVLGNNGGLAKVFDGNSVTEIRANLGAGFNLLDIDLTVSNGGDFDHEGFDQNPVILVTAGNDSDTVTINLGDADGGGGGGEGDDDGRGDVVVTASLAGGNDRFTLLAEGDFGGSFNCTMNMGSGNDSICVELAGDLDGDASVIATLGTGNDTYKFTNDGDIKSEFEWLCDADTGKDEVTLDVGGTISGNAVVSVDLGDGNDSFAMSVGGDLSGEFGYFVEANNGNDTASLDVSGNVDCPSVCIVDMGSSNDNWSLSIGGDINGFVNVIVATNSGNDVVNILVEGDVNGLTFIDVDLGSGNDNLAVEICGNIVSDEEVIMLFDGGIGLDTATFTFAPDELTDIDLEAVFFEDVTYDECGGGGGMGLPGTEFQPIGLFVF